MVNIIIKIRIDHISVLEMPNISEIEKKLKLLSIPYLYE